MCRTNPQLICRVADAQMSTGAHIQGKAKMPAYGRSLHSGPIAARPRRKCSTYAINHFVDYRYTDPDHSVAGLLHTSLLSATPPAKSGLAVRMGTRL
jgi:hypothetical protein